MTHQHYTRRICQWPAGDRPREKLAQYGEQSLSDSELLAILLRTGVKGESAVDLARKILARFKTFRAMSQSSPSEWTNIKGLGPAKAAQIKAALEIGRRFRDGDTAGERPKIQSSNDVVLLLMPRMRDCKIEIFKTVYLDASNRVIDIVEETKGTVNFAAPIIREIFKKALDRFAVGIICAHNHPSGEITPSLEDRAFTQKLIDAGKLMQVKVLDHIIIGDNRFYSFADEGKM